jgi:hypothetical protein
MEAPDLANNGEVIGYEFRSNEKRNHHHSEALYSSHPGNNPSTNPTTSNTALLNPSPIPPSESALSYAPSQSLSNDHLIAPTPETRRVRELDAGPVPGHFQDEDNAETLPPEYGQLFNNRLPGQVSNSPLLQPVRRM